MPLLWRRRSKMIVLLAEPPPAPHGIPHGAGFPGYFASTPPRLYPVHQQLWQSQQRMQELQRRRLAPPMHPVGGYVAADLLTRLDVRSLVRYCLILYLRVQVNRMYHKLGSFKISWYHKL